MKTRVTMKLVWLGLALAFTLAVASAVTAQPGEFVNGVLQPLADGFPNKAIKLVNSDDPGSKDGIYGRTIQAALKGISPVDIIVSDEPTAAWGTFVKLKDVLDREGGSDGYYPVILMVWGSSTDVLTEPITEELGLDLSDMNMVIVTEHVPLLFVQRKNAPWGRTWADLVKYGKANPDKLRRMTASIGGGSDIMAEWVLQHFGVKVKVIPQPSQEKALAALGAGEGDIQAAPASIIQPHLEAGRADVIMVMAKTVPPPWDKDPNIVSMAMVGLPLIPIGATFGLAVPKQVPTTHVNWLFKLFKAAASTDLYKQREKTNLALQVTIMDPAQANTLKYKYVELADSIVRSVGLHVDQRKKK